MPMDAVECKCGRKGKGIMEEDLLLSLTRQVKEEVVENYISERRLIELQIEDFHAQAERVRECCEETCRRFARIAYLMIQQEMVKRVMSLMGVPESSYWDKLLCRKFSRKVRFIHVAALTRKSKFRKLVIEAYARLRQWMEKYRRAYEDLQEECRGVNRNIKDFQARFDVLTMMSFLKSLDVLTEEQKHFLGENFTAEEVCSIDQKLCIHPLNFKDSSLPVPLALPPLEVIRSDLAELAHEVYHRYQPQARDLMESQAHHGP